VKPNFIRDFRETQEGDGECLTTHGSIIRATLDYVYVALRGQGRIVIADAPQNDADFQALCAMAGLDEIREFYRRYAGFEVEVVDLRPEKARKLDGVIVGHDALPGDPAGYVKVDLGDQSAFMGVRDLCHLLYGAEYDTGELREHHHDNVHEYLLSRTVLEADCVINLAKLKTHKKTGLTVAMKNLVGINGNKNWLPHHRQGTPSQGGDQFADDRLRNRLERRAVEAFKRVFPLVGPLRPQFARLAKRVGKRMFGDTNTDRVRSGNWYGNDTTWRMVVDLNRAFLRAGANGRLGRQPSRKSLVIVDGIVGGEGNGPLDPCPKPAGVVLAGRNAVAVDLAAARIMGFDYRRIPLLARSLGDPNLAPFTYGDVQVRSNDPAMNRRLCEYAGTMLGFKPHFGWKGHIEIGR